MAMTAKDFDIRISTYDTTHTVAWNIAANASGTSYYGQWTQCEVRQKMSDISTFTLNLSGVVSTTLPIAVNNVVGVIPVYNELVTLDNITATVAGARETVLLGSELKKVSPVR